MSCTRTRRGRGRGTASSSASLTSKKVSPPKAEKISRFFAKVPREMGESGACSDSPYKNCLSEVKCAELGDLDDFRTPTAVKKVSKIAQVKPPKGKPAKRKKSASGKAPMRKFLEDNFKGGDVNAEQLQMALALSESSYEAESSDKREKMESFKKALEKYGFGYAKNRVEVENRRDFCEIVASSKKNNKKSRYRYVTPILKMRTPQERDDLIASKVSLILAQNNTKTNNAQSDLQLFSEMLQKFHRQKIFKLNHLGLEELNSANIFSVGLNLEVSSGACGHLLKDWGSIAGREASPQREIPQNHPRSISPDLFASDDEMHDQNNCSNNLNQSETAQITCRDSDQSGNQENKEAITCYDLTQSDDEGIGEASGKEFSTSPKILNDVFENFSEKPKRTRTSRFQLSSPSSEGSHLEVAQNDLEWDTLFKPSEQQGLFSAASRLSPEHFSESPKSDHRLELPESPIKEPHLSPEFMNLSPDINDKPKRTTTSRFQLSSSSSEDTVLEIFQNSGETCSPNRKSLEQQHQFLSPERLSDHRLELSPESPKQKPHLSPESPEAEPHLSPDLDEEPKRAKTSRFPMSSEGSVLEILENSEKTSEKCSPNRKPLDHESLFKSPEQQHQFLSPERLSGHRLELSPESPEAEPHLSPDFDEEPKRTKTSRFRLSSPSSEGSVLEILEYSEKTSEKCSPNQLDQFSRASFLSPEHFSESPKSGHRLDLSPEHFGVDWIESPPRFDEIMEPHNSARESQEVPALGSFAEVSPGPFSKLEKVSSSEDDLQLSQESIYISDDELNYSSVCATPPAKRNSENIPPNTNRSLGKASFNKIETPQNSNVVVKMKNVTPMANFDAMDTPRIVRELDKFGLKPLKRQRGAKLLKYIYESTHPLVGGDSSDEDEGAKRRRTGSLHFEGIVGDIEEDEPIFERTQSKKIASCRVPLHIVWHNFVMSNPEIREKILLYEPLQLEALHSMLKEQGFKFNVQDLLTFLDRKCITMRTAQGQRNGKKHA